MSKEFRQVDKKERKAIRKLENQHFDAAFDLEQVALDWGIEYLDTLRERADEGCDLSARFIEAIDRYMETWETFDRADTDAKFCGIVIALEHPRPGGPIIGPSRGPDDH